MLDRLHLILLQPTNSNRIFRYFRLLLQILIGITIFNFVFALETIQIRRLSLLSLLTNYFHQIYYNFPYFIYFQNIDFPYFVNFQNIDFGQLGDCFLFSLHYFSSHLLLFTHILYTFNVLIWITEGVHQIKLSTCSYCISEESD